MRLGASLVDYHPQPHRGASPGSLPTSNLHSEPADGKTVLRLRKSKASPPPRVLIALHLYASGGFNYRRGFQDVFYPVGALCTDHRDRHSSFLQIVDRIKAN